jgi:hypothetical protein
MTDETRGAPGAPRPEGNDPPGPDWWLASDGKWYPPDTRPASTPHGADSKQGPGWWLASDGKWYPPESRSASPPRAPGTVSKGLTGTLRGFLIAGGVLGAIGGVVTINHANTFSRVFGPADAPLSDLASAEDLSGAVLGFFFLAVLTISVLVIVWLYQAYRAVETHHVSGTSWSPGWAVGAWFIPFANFVIPKLVFNEVDRISAAAEEGNVDTWRQRRPLSVSNGWWIAFVVGAVFVAVGGSIVSAQAETVFPDIDLYENGLWIEAIGLFAYGLAGFLGAATVKAIGDRLT